MPLYKCALDLLLRFNNVFRVILVRHCVYAISPYLYIPERFARENGANDTSTRD